MSLRVGMFTCSLTFVFFLCHSPQTKSVLIKRIIYIYPCVSATIWLLKFHWTHNKMADQSHSQQDGRPATTYKMVDEPPHTCRNHAYDRNRHKLYQMLFYLNTCQTLVCRPNTIALTYLLYLNSHSNFKPGNFRSLYFHTEPAFRRSLQPPGDL